MQKPKSDQTKTPAKVADVFEVFRQGAGFGLFLGMAAAFLSEGEFFQCTFGGVILGLTIWPVLVACLTSVAGKQGAIPSMVRFFGFAIAGVVLIAFVASVAYLICLKLYVDLH